MQTVSIPIFVQRNKESVSLDEIAANERTNRPHKNGLGYRSQLNW
jgi:hypothetical protein